MEIYTTERKKAKKALGLIPEHQHVLVIDDCLSPSVLEDLLDLLYISADETIEISVFCKGTPQSARVIEKDYAKVEHFHIWKDLSKRSVLIASADLLVTRPDSSILYRARDSHTPMVLTPAKNTTERINLIYYTDSGYALSAASEVELCDACIELLNNPENLQRMTSMMS